MGWSGFQTRNREHRAAQTPSAYVGPCHQDKFTEDKAIEGC